MDMDSQSFGAQYIEHADFDVEMEDLRDESLVRTQSNSSRGSMTVHRDVDR